MVFSTIFQAIAAMVMILKEAQIMNLKKITIGRSLNLPIIQIHQMLLFHSEEILSGAVKKISLLKYLKKMNFYG